MVDAAGVELFRVSKKMPQVWIERFVNDFGAIAMPKTMMIASLVVAEFHVPWGTAVIRCEEEKWKVKFAKTK